MSYELFAIPACQRALKKLPQEVQDHLFEKFQHLRDDPHANPQLHGKMHFLRSLHTRHKNTDYRAVYEVDEKNRRIILWYAASRENFYKELHRIPVKRIA